MTTTRHDKQPDEQVADIQLCDIIAQQREFQRRQETRSSQVPLTSHLQEPTGSSKPNRGRKFSLSHAMSSFASSLAAAGSGSSGNLSADTPTRRSPNINLNPAPPPRPPPRRGLQHRASLVTGGPSTTTASSQQADIVEKKKGFVHKAIRRGSKMFDAMMLSSSLSQADKEQDSSERKKSADSESNSVSPDRDTGGSGSGGGGQRVQFAASSIELEADKQPEESSGERSRRRKPRRLRLGSIPHDLRRALSLSNNSQRSSGGHQRAEPEAGQPAAAAASLSQEPPPPPADNLQTPAQTPKPAGRLQMGSSQTDLDGGGVRLRRKNSLFSPLSHAVHHYHAVHRVSQETTSAEAKLTGQQQQQNIQTTTANNNSQQAGQSASFSLCQDHSRTYKLIIFGSSAVGKTSLIQRFLYGQFPVAHKPTVEELHSNKYNIPELGEIYLEILDTSGTFEFPAMRRLSIEKGDAFILVFSLSDSNSWEEVKHLRELILEEKGASWEPAGSSKQQPGSQIKQGRPASTPLEFQPEVASGPINSIYAAAAKLTSGRRLSTIGACLEESQATTTTTTTTSVTSGERRASQANPKQVIAPDKAAEELTARPFTHYNSQLSKLLQQRQQSSHLGGKASRHRKRPGGGLLEQSLSIDDRDSSLYSSSSNSNSSSSSSGFEATAKLQSSRLSKKPATSGFGTSAAAKPAETGSATRRCRTPIVVVANKCDLEASNLEVDREAAERLVCDQWGNSFVCCSAKEAINIDKVFKELLRQARAPEILSQFVIDDHQQRRQSLPVLKNHLSAHNLKGLRNLYNQQQQQQHHQAGAAPEVARPVSTSSEDSQCRIM